MRVEVRRTRRGTWSGLLNLILTAAAGVVLTGNAMVRTEPSMLGLAAGVLLLVWALVILSALLRPVQLALDGQGLRIRRLLGAYRFGWDDLLWVDFDTGARVALIVARAGGRTRYAGISKRTADPEALDRALAAIRARRPGLPTRNPGLKEAA